MHHDRSAVHQSAFDSGRRIHLSAVFIPRLFIISIQILKSTWSSYHLFYYLHSVVMLLFWLPGVLFGLMDFHWIEFHSTPGRCIIWWNQISLQSTFLLHSLYNEMQKQGHCFLIACNTRGVFIHNQIAYANCSETSWSNTNDEWCLVNLESDDCQVTHFVGCFLRGNCHHLCHFHLLTSPAFDLCTTLTAALLATLLFLFTANDVLYGLALCGLGRLYRDKSQWNLATLH